MKKLIIGLLFLGVTNLSFSQNTNYGITEVELEGVVVTAPNYTYLNKVFDKNTPNRVRQLELEAAKYNIKDDSAYDPRFSVDYEVVFKQANGRINAKYDNDGELISCSEKFLNVKLPVSIISSNIFEDNNGWTLHKDAYLVSYKKGRDVKKVYKVQLRKGKQKKNFTINMEGDLKGYSSL